MNKETRWASRTGKGKEKDSLLESLKRNRALLTTDFSPVRPKSDFCSLRL